MNDKQTSIIYEVNSDLDSELLFAEFETKEAAIAYAKRNIDRLPFVDEVEVTYDDQGEVDDVISRQTVWAHNDEVYPTNEDEEEDYWDMLSAEYEDQEDGRHAMSGTFNGINADELVETLEENETEVECKECFDLFPKTDCVKVAFGYICPTCAKCEVADEDMFKMDFPEYEKFPGENEMIPGEPDPEPMPDNLPDPDPMSETEETENTSISDPEEVVPFLVKDEEEAIAGYDEATEVIQDSDIENKEEILDTLDHIKEEEKEHIEELQDLEVDTNTKDENDPISNPEEIETPEDDTAELEELFDIGLNVGIDGGENNNVSVLSSHKPKKGEEDLTELFDANVNLSLDGGTGNDVSVLSPLGGVGLGEGKRPVKEDYIADLSASISKDFLYNAIVTEGDVMTLIINSEEDADGNTIEQSWEILDADGIFSVVEHYYNVKTTDVVEGDFVFETDDFDTFYARLQREYPEVFIGSEKLTEHVNEEHLAIESDQELEGTDNAVVKCKVAKVVTHSEDEKPVDCEGKKTTKVVTEGYQKFTPEEMEEYGIDEDGNSIEGYDEYVRCTWCEDIFTKDDCGFEADLGWLCDRCQMAISSRGERLSMVINPTEDDFKRVMNEDIPMTSDELINKYGTDDVDLINAGKEPEERVALQEEAPEYDLTEVNKLLKEIRGADKKKSIHMR